MLIEAGDPTLMATTMAAMTAPGSDPFGPGGELEGHEAWRVWAPVEMTKRSW